MSRDAQVLTSKVLILLSISVFRMSANESAHCLCASRRCPIMWLGEHRATDSRSVRWTISHCQPLSLGLRGGEQPAGPSGDGTGSGKRARGGYLRGRGGRGGSGARGAKEGRSSHRQAPVATARDIRRGGDDSVLCHFLGKETYIKCEGQREFTGTVLSYDSYGNLMLDNTTEWIMECAEDGDENAVSIKHTRFLGLTMCHGKNILAMWPTEGSRDIDDPFPEHEHAGLAESGIPLDPDEDLPPRAADTLLDASSEHEGMPFHPVTSTSTRIPGVEAVSLEQLSLLGAEWSHMDGGLDALNVSLAARSAPPGLKQWIL